MRRLEPKVAWLVAGFVLWVNVVVNPMGSGAWTVALLVACVGGWSRMFPARKQWMLLLRGVVMTAGTMLLHLLPDAGGPTGPYFFPSALVVFSYALLLSAPGATALAALVLAEFCAACWLAQPSPPWREMLVHGGLLAVIPPALFVSAMGWVLPGPLVRTVTLFAQVTTGLALFVIGGALVGLQLKGKRRLVAQIAFGKLLLHPLCVFLAFTFLVPIADPQLRTAALLFAAMPMLGVYPILALKHGHEEVSAAALLATTVGSFFTLNVLLWGLKHYPL